ncbi:WG repeat-containing protein [Aquimarina sp. 2201CG5-10]|uniref:WG repeat-containing protein n=1 Tax=Aquimarina callyspongiae TaxID=3098150 RepID=UPI002AB5CC8E|nr:WG repeat-containing protein [Aquimarina sp. 2201CG5-10]MDY8136880.1 WG repeat-containing protein [Aquimarina sp. 2201CG5-10]
MKTHEQPQYFPQLIPFRKGDKWGFSDREKNIIIPLKYDQTYPFIDNVALVRIEDKYGLISSTDETLLPITYDDGEMVIDEAYDKGWRTPVSTNFYPKIPKEVINSIEDIKEFSDGIAPFKRNNKWGLITEEGKELLSPEYDAIKSIENENWPFIHNNKWGLLSKTGALLIEAKFDETRGFSNGQAACKKDENWGAIDQNGEWIVAPQFSELGELRDGVSAAQKNGLYGFINEKGEVVIDFQFQYALDFNNGICAIFEDEFIYFIDKQGQKVSDSYIRMFGPDEECLMHVVKDEKWGLIKPDGTFLLPIQYDLPKAMGQVLHTIERKRIPIKKGALLGYANYKGEEIVTPKYCTIDPFCENLSLVSRLDPNLNFNNTIEDIEATGSISGVFNFGFIDADGKEIVPPKYILAHRFEGGLAFVKNSDFQCGYITYDGTEYFM